MPGEMPADMIDAHCHILPGMDDGPMDISESVEMARVAAGDGIHKIIATPHIYDSGALPEDIAAGVNRLNRILAREGIPVAIYPGAEVAMGMDIEKSCRYTMNRSRYVLIEFPHDHLPSHAGKLLNWLSAQGLKPIIAHPERNYGILRSPETLLGLLNPDVYVQITAGSLTGDFGRDILFCAEFLLDAGKVDLIASDAHSGTIRPPRLSLAAEYASKRIGKTAAARLVRTNPEAVLANEDMHRK